MFGVRRAVTAQIPRVASRSMSTQIPKVGAGARAAVTWAFPVLVGFTWVIWPALDPEWLLEKGLGPDPEADLTMVHNARMARLEAYQKQHGGSSAAKEEDADEEEEEEEEESAEEEANEEEESGEEGEEEQSSEGGGDEESGDAEEDEEEEEEIKLKPLFEPTKGTQGGGWDTFSVKSLKFGEDDDEDDEDDDE
ncbi:hypothetical protein FisN_22Hh014 [Fistulifera solaris]|uniref:Uncharacterized protein n=1 Tax=Fistulifera solaris TaxID=1519565 RepID=A0A1Z5K375_FISSO|nr:hypothetical protein FisN_22Hh014 [Fistulifera solaris]|eukprot:GAX20448.1 hypothetical protein FisN_22Hh014 [Fistulifera solaris]